MRLVEAFGLALLIGLRHATDPDHLAAVTTLIASQPDDGAARARRLGFAWGMGHATTLIIFGLPVVLLGASLPHGVQHAAEFAVGVLIMVLAIRLLVRWRRGRFHTHAHRHGETEHRHLHPHGAGETHEHEHAPQAQLGRGPAQAYGIGLVHGVGGSAGVGVLLLAGIPSHSEAAAALVVFALAAAVSMSVLSSTFGFLLTRGPVLQRLLALTPAMGVAALLFGAWYAGAAL